MAIRPTSIADHTDDWQQILAAMEANVSELQLLEPLRLELVDTLAQVQVISTEEKANRAERQQATARRKEALARGKDLVSRLRSGIRSVYGAKNEKLVMFGVTPFRRRVRSQAPPPPVETPEKPEPALADSKPA